MNVAEVLHSPAPRHGRASTADFESGLQPKRGGARSLLHRRGRIVRPRSSPQPEVPPIDSPLVLIDLDGALVELRPSGRPHPDLLLRENAREGLSRLRDDATVVILVDPTGCDLLLPHQRDVRAAFARRNLGGAAARVPMVACRHQRGQPCACRKPSGGLLERARDELGLDLQHAWLIGDEGDVTAGRTKALRTIRVGPSAGDRSGPTVAPDYEARDLLDAANWILLQEALAVA